MFLCTQLGLVKSLNNSLYENFQIDMSNIDSIVKEKKMAKARYNVFGLTFWTLKTTFPWKNCERKNESFWRDIKFTSKTSMHMFVLSFARHQRSIHALQGYN